jgi:hypothetical protein
VLVEKEGTNKFTHENAIKRLLVLSKPEPGELEFRVDGSIWKNGKLIAERMTEEQEEWLEKRMCGSARSWERWFVGHYFTEEQKKELGLTDEDIAGKGIK